MKSVDILLRTNCLQHPISVDLVGQRKLHKNSVDRRIGIESRHEGQKLFFRRLHRQSVVKTDDPDLLAVPFFGSDVGDTRGILSHEDNRKPRWCPRFSEGRDPIREFELNLCRYLFPIDDRMCHGSSQSTVKGGVLSVDIARDSIGRARRARHCLNLLPATDWFTSSFSPGFSDSFSEPP
jgi:hypothetical protein